MSTRTPGGARAWIEGPQQLAALWDWNDARSGCSGVVVSFSTQLWVLGVVKRMLEEVAQLLPEVSVLSINETSGERWNLSGDGTGPLHHLHAVTGPVMARREKGALLWAALEHADLTKMSAGYDLVFTADPTPTEHLKHRHYDDSHLTEAARFQMTDGSELVLPYSFYRDWQRLAWVPGGRRRHLRKWARKVVEALPDLNSASGHPQERRTLTPATNPSALELEAARLVAELDRVGIRSEVEMRELVSLVREHLDTEAMENFQALVSDNASTGGAYALVRMARSLS